MTRQPALSGCDIVPNLYTGGDPYVIFHATIPLWSVLLIYSLEGARVQKHCLDC